DPIPLALPLRLAAWVDLDPGIQCLVFEQKLYWCPAPHLCRSDLAGQPSVRSWSSHHSCERLTYTGWQTRWFVDVIDDQTDNATLRLIWVMRLGSTCRDDNQTSYKTGQPHVNSCESSP